MLDDYRFHRQLHTYAIPDAPLFGRASIGASTKARLIDCFQPGSIRASVPSSAKAAAIQSLPFERT